MARCDYDKKLITVDKEKAIASSIIHELYHAEDSRLPEEIVEALERVRMRGMTHAEAVRIVNLLEDV